MLCCVVSFGLHGELMGKSYQKNREGGTGVLGLGWGLGWAFGSLVVGQLRLNWDHHSRLIDGGKLLILSSIDHVSYHAVMLASDL